MLWFPCNPFLSNVFLWRSQVCIYICRFTYSWPQLEVGILVYFLPEHMQTVPPISLWNARCSSAIFFYPTCQKKYSTYISGKLFCSQFRGDVCGALNGIKFWTFATFQQMPKEQLNKLSFCITTNKLCHCLSASLQPGKDTGPTVALM